MAEGPQPTAEAVLAVLAALSPAAEAQSGKRTIPLDWFRWLPADAVRAFVTLMGHPVHPVRPQNFLEALATTNTNTAEIQMVPIDRKFAERLAAVDQIRVGQRSLRIGWLFIAGTATGADGKAVRVFHPLVTVPVRVFRVALTAGLLPAGDAELTPLIEDPAIRQDLEQHLEFGGGALDGMSQVAIPGPFLAKLDRLRHFALAAAKAAGLSASELIPAGAGPEELLQVDRLRVVAGAAVYAVTDTGGMSRAATLRSWAAAGVTSHTTKTAFHALYLGGGPSTETVPEGAEAPVESAYPLTPTQRHAIVRSRSDTITVVSGAPGTGKSHAIVAVACDTLALGGSVLVAAKSDDAVDALIELLERAPGPDPVVFGSRGRREALAKRLAEGQVQPLSAREVAQHRHRLDAAVARRDALRSTIADDLAAESLLGSTTDDSEWARIAAPSLFDPGADLEAARQLLARASSTGRGWIARRRRRSGRRHLDDLAGSSPDTDLDDLGAALATARAWRQGRDLVSAGGLDLSTRWDDLEAADDEVRRLVGGWLARECRSSKRINASTLPSLTALATALRSGRAARRAQLTRLDRKVLRALPLWIGSLPDIDDLLPMLPGFFDLAILDEASSIDQPLAAAALLRAARAVVVGDPHQLRHVSFLSDDQTQRALADAGLDRFPDLGSRLDVRRNSIFDVATGVSPVTVLDEHFRSDPHLIDWVARRIYGGNLKVATRSPQTECKDCIDICRISGQRDGGGVVPAEVAWVVTELQNLRAAGSTNVGVITPFRAQADALEAAILSAFSADDLEALDLRVGTVHAFQGNERDLMIASLGVGAGAPSNAWQFVADTHLFDVMVTRARKSFRIVTSADPPRPGLVADYFQQADTPPGRPAPVRTLDTWSRLVADDLSTAGLPVATSYPTGRHVVDVCVACPDAAVSIECAVHPDGPEAHIDRHLALRASGWHLLGAFKSKWGDHQGELAIELMGLLVV
ncbi:MAG TPA: AAA domain-containing protein [Acidimicrobiales bacterium]|jgi:hypothetical protein|nr:AAA domain-containing protein [Acidimicrobiales bacterium]